MDEDYYKVLGLSRNASGADIQRAYRALARKYHPDLNPDDKSAKQKFQAVQQAYEVLNDPQKREMYDRYGSSFETAGGGGPAGGAWRVNPGGGRSTQFEDFDFSQVFGERFGRDAAGGFADIFRQFRRGTDSSRQRRKTPTAGVDLQHHLEIPFTTAVTGGQAQLRIKRSDGHVETISVKIPAGIAEGKMIRLRGQGEKPAGGGQPGDILITVHVSPHPYFQRRGNDLEVKVPVTLSEAAAGAKVDIPTPNGTITLTIPPCTSSGRRLRIRGQGVRMANGSTGDLFAEIQIILPPSLDQESLESLRKVSAKSPPNPRSELKW